MNNTDLQGEIDKINRRNKQVELDKAWETSRVRKISIALLTYILVVIFLFLVHNSNPRLNALVPTGGFILSTLSLDIIKRIWMQKQ